MQFMRSTKSSTNALAESYAPADPRALISALLDIITATPTAGPELTVIRILHEVDRWEAAGPDADKAYAGIKD